LIFGLFFLNSSSSLAKKYDNNSTLPSSNLVFFLFDSIPENIKDSLLNNNTNTYLIRKPLFTSQKIFQKNSNIHQSMDSNSSTNKVSFIETYRFYMSKTMTNLERSGKANNSSNDFNLSKTNSNNNSGNNTFNSTIPTPTNLIKKCYSITDILKYHLGATTSSSSIFSLNCLNFIEETCAKSYIKSIIHFMGIYAMQYAQRTLSVSQSTMFNLNPPLEKNFPFELVANTACKQKFEANSISSLLKIAKKNKIIDLDLTDYLKKNCSHLKNQKGDDSNVKQCCFDKKCSNSQAANSAFLEKKFNELFFKNFTLLPGFNDMFIFTSFQQLHHQTNENNSKKSKLQKMNSWHKRRAASLLIIEQALNDSNLPMDNENDDETENENDAIFSTNDLKNMSSSDSCDECETTNHDSDSSSSDNSVNNERRRRQRRSHSTTSSFSDDHNVELGNAESMDDIVDAYDNCEYYSQENVKKGHKDDRKSKDNDEIELNGNKQIINP
jgi:hypothetical protein